MTIQRIDVGRESLIPLNQYLCKSPSLETYANITSDRPSTDLGSVEKFVAPILGILQLESRISLGEDGQRLLDDSAILLHQPCPATRMSVYI